MIPMKSNILNNQKKMRAVFILFFGVVGFVPYPSILGLWESQTIFHIFAPEHIWYNTIMHPRANIGGFEYFPLDLTRIVAAIFGFNLFSIRLLPIIYGFLSLFFFYQIVRKWCDENVSLLTTGLLATNSLFLVFQHQLLITIVDILCILACIYFFLEANSNSKKVIYFGIICAITALLYHTGRYFMLTLVGIWAFQLIKRGSFKDAYPLLKKFILSFLVTLVVCNPVNLYRFFNIKFLIPEEGGAGVNEFAMGLNDFFENLRVNLPLTFHSFLGGNDFYGDYPTEVIVSIPYGLLNWPLLLLVLLGGVIIIVRKELSKLTLIGMLIFLCFGIPNLSQVWPHIWSSLSPYRQIFGIIPLYMLIGIAIYWLVKKWKKMSPLIYFSVIILITLQVYSYIQEIQRANQIVANSDCDFQGSKFSCHIHNERYIKTKLNENKTFEDGQSYYSPFVNGYDFLENNIIVYKAYVNQIIPRIKQISSSKKPLLIDIPATHFKSKCVPSIYNCHQLFLALYLAEEGLNINYYVPYPGEKNASYFENIFNFLLIRLTSTQSSAGHRSSYVLKYPIRYNSGQYDLANNFIFWSKIKEKIITKIPQSYHSYIHQFYHIFQLPSKNNEYHFAMRKTGSNSKIYLVTTDLERKLFLSNFDDYIEVKI